MPAAPQRGRPRKPRPAGLSGQLGGRIELLRKERGWSADELGAAAGLGTGTVLRVERGEQSSTLDTVLAIAHALGKSGAELLRGCPAWTDKPKGEYHAPPEV
jgi:transcriptional regulator with XRE-family HTH domain